MKALKHTPKYALSPLWSLLAAVLLAGAVTLLCLWAQPNSLRSLLSGFRSQPLLIALNALPVGLLLLALAFLFRNVFYGAALAELFCAGLSVANRIKLQVRDEPVFPRDFALLKEVGSAVGTYEIQWPWGILALIFLVFLLLLALGWFVGCRLPEFGGKKVLSGQMGGSAVYLASAKGESRWPLRLAGAAVSLAAMAVLTVTVYASNDLYNSFRVSNAYYVPSVFNELGFPYCFTHHFTTYTIDRPEGFSRSAAEEWDQGGQPSGAPDVHVVMVMDEAFSDITDSGAFSFRPEDDPLPNLHALRQEENCLSGHVVVPGFAGGTANTEFDVLTGMQTNALSATTTSALRAVNRNLDSLFRLYGTDGYHTAFYHPGDAWFYNRENVYRFFGAEEILFAGDMENLDYKGRWVTDSYLAGLIEDKFQEAVSAGETLFSFTTTIQNHMSYTADKYGEGYEFPPVPTSGLLLSKEAETLLTVYTEGARDADAMLGRLWRYFDRQSEPVVLVFFGDHLPYLGDNQLAYRELGLDIGPAGEGGQMSLASYETPYVIWANDAAARTLDWQSAAAAASLPEDGAISACYLGATLVELTGRTGESPWFDFLNQLRRELPVVQKNIYVTADGRESTEPAGALAEDIAKWRQWSYYKLKYKEVRP